MHDYKNIDPRRARGKVNKVKGYINELYKMNYKERPVDIGMFISHQDFLGNSTEQGHTIRPCWSRELKRFMPNDSKWSIILTGAIGTGKTSAAIIGVAYVMHRVLCLRDPWGYFDLNQAGRMAISFFNLTKTLGKSKGFGLLQSYLLNSPWFLSKGRVMGKSEDSRRIEFPLFSFVLSSPRAEGSGVIGEDVLIAIMDELDSPTESAKQKVKVIKAYEATERRFESRFVRNSRSIGKMFLVSSKQDEMSFLNTYIDDMKGSNRVYVVDMPLWEAKSSGNYSGEKFIVSVGDAYHEPRVLYQPEEVKQARIDGFQVIEVPIEYRDEFERDMVGALRDIAGVSVTGIRKSHFLPSEQVIYDCYDDSKLEPMKKLTIDVGLRDEDIELAYFIDYDRIRMERSVPRAVHLDIAFAHGTNCLALAMSGVCGWSSVESESEDGARTQERMPVVETDFVVRLRARENDEIPLNKVIRLVLDLRALGFNIRRFTADLKIASAHLLQTLNRSGLKAESFSVDKDVKAYMDFRQMMFDKRWVFHKNPIVHFELKNLIFDRERQKVDHPEKVTDVEIMKSGDVRDIVLVGSKDLADAICGSVIGAVSIIEGLPDNKRLKELLQRVRKSASVKEDPYWWVSGVKSDGGKTKVVAAGGSIPTSDMEKFTKILKKSTKGGKA